MGLTRICKSLYQGRVPAGASALVEVLVKKVNTVCTTGFVSHMPRQF